MDHLKEHAKYFFEQHFLITDEEDKPFVHSDLTKKAIEERKMKSMKRHEGKKRYIEKPPNLLLIKKKFFGPDAKTRSLRASKARVWRAIVAEFIATGLFVFFATGAVVVALNFDPSGGIEANLFVAFTQAFALAIAIYYSANVSGGQLNPVVTLSFVLVGRMRFIVALLYWVAQITGAIIGSLLVREITPDAERGALGATTLAEGYSVGHGILLEAIMTFLLVSTVYATAIDRIGFGKAAPLGIGLTIFVDLAIGWRHTGASMNPARSLGPAIVSSTWTDHYVYWIGPLLGGIIAAWLYDFIMITRPENKNPFAAGTRMETEGRPIRVTRGTRRHSSAPNSASDYSDSDNSDDNPADSLIDEEDPKQMETERHNNRLSKDKNKDRIENRSLSGELQHLRSQLQTSSPTQRHSVKKTQSST